MNPSLIIQLLLVVLPKLKDYFTKNGGVNSVSGGFLGWLLGVGTVAMTDTATVDQFITWLMHYGVYGLYAAGIVAGIRTAVFTVKGGLPKLVDAAKKQDE